MIIKVENKDGDIIDALQITSNYNVSEIYDFINNKSVIVKRDKNHISIENGPVTTYLVPGEWLIKNSNNSFACITDDIVYITNVEFNHFYKVIEHSDIRRYKGKDFCNGKWIYGNLLQYNSGECAIIKETLSHFGNEPYEMEIDKVHPSTICSYIGINSIYEHDIIEANYKHDECGINGVVPDQDCRVIGEIIYNQQDAAFELKIIYTEIRNILYKDELYPISMFDLNDMYIDGNSFDNPELLNSKDL